MTKSKFSIFFLCLISFISVSSQELDDLFAQKSIYEKEWERIFVAHKRNIKDLRVARGYKGQEIEVKYTLRKKFVAHVLNEYKDNVGVLIYSYKNDTLIMALLDKKNNFFIKKRHYNKDSLINDVTSTNKYFFSQSENRGAITTNTKKATPKINKSFAIVNEVLLPFKERIIELDHLIIVPTFNIGTLPFSAFYLNKKSRLIDNLSYSIAPSLLEIATSKQRNIDRLGNTYEMKVNYFWENALFVADVDYAKDSIWDFSKLPGTLKEVNYITKSFDKSSFVLLKGKEATISNIKDKICEYDLLYFATHGISNSNRSLDNSFLVFAEGRNKNSFLTAREIQEIGIECKLKADLVVLSACQTGLGREHAGGVIGISRAFLLAGANHVLMSLWNIDDNETAKVMSFFFDELKLSKNLQPHEALRQAILKYKNEVNDDPKYWAAFSIFGVPY